MDWTEIDPDTFFVGRQIEVSRVCFDYWNTYKTNPFPFETIEDDKTPVDEVVMVYRNWPDTKAEIINTRTWERRLDTEFLEHFPQGRTCRKCGQPSIEAGSPRNWCKTCVKEDREQKLLEASAMFYQIGAERIAETLPDGVEKQQMLAATRLFKSVRPSIQKQEQWEFEQLQRKWEAEEKAREVEKQFLARELNRMKSLPEPIFILNLPDELIQKLIAAKFTTAGEVLFGVQVASERVVSNSDPDDFIAALVHSRDFLLHAVGEEGYNLIGSRLIQYGYLQRDYFLSELKREAKHKPAKGNEGK